MQSFRVGQPITVAVGEPFKIEAPYGGLGGSVLTVNYPDSLRLLSEDVLVGKQLGGKPLKSYTMLCQREGTFDLNFESKRPWEEHGSSKHTKVRCVRP